MPIERRNFLRSVAGAGALALAPRFVEAEEQVARATRATPAPRIKDISVIECQPDGVRLTIVKITTDQDGLYGYGCATFTQRADLVKPAVEKYLKPFLLGKTTDRFEDIWQSCYDSSYWKNGPVLNNAISGIDQALWDIKGRQAGMPVYQLAGGKCREAVDCYAHASGNEFDDVVADAKKYIAQGFRNVRVQVGLPGMAGYGSQHKNDGRPKALHDKPLFNKRRPFVRAVEEFAHGDGRGALLADLPEPGEVFRRERVLNEEDVQLLDGLAELHGLPGIELLVHVRGPLDFRGELLTAGFQQLEGTAQSAIAIE